MAGVPGKHRKKLNEVGPKAVAKVTLAARTKQDAAKELGVSYDALKYYLVNELGWENGTYGLAPPEGAKVQDVELPVLPPGDFTYEEIKELRMREFEKVDEAKKARKLVTARVKRKGPIALFFFGDPHVDDAGTDLKTLYEHTDLINRTDGMLACNIGDTTNNWVGRLRALYAEQTVTANQAWVLAEGWLRELEGKWLFLIGGNHDLWSGAGDPLKWITRGMGHYEEHGYRIQLKFPNGASRVINARHDWPGHSQWNPTHGPLKAAELGFRDDIYIAGHKHTSGYQVIKTGSGNIAHAARVASYKMHDGYAEKLALRDLTISPCIVFTIDPEDDGPDGIKQFWDPEVAADYLKFLQKRAK